MATFEPITSNWLSGAFQQMMEDDAELTEAYGWADYPSDMEGEGNWVDLYLTEDEEHPVGRLWMNPDSGDIGLIALRWGNTDYLTKIALELREYKRHGVTIFQAYDQIKGEYFAVEEQTGELKEAKVKVASTQ